MLKRIIAEINYFLRGVYKSLVAPLIFLIPAILYYLKTRINWYAGDLFHISNRNYEPRKLSNLTHFKSGMPDFDVVFVGAGPTGLWTAIQLKLHDPKIKIIMFEKYPEYTRERDVYVRKTSFVGAHDNEDFQQLIAKFIGKTTINNIESKLLDYAEQLGIEVINEEIKDCRHLKSRFPFAKFFVGSDGSRSVVRQQIFADAKDQFNVSRIVEVKYKIDHHAARLSVPSRLEWITKSEYYSRESVNLGSDGLTTVRLRLIVDEHTYSQIGDMTFSQPGSFDDNLQQNCPKLYMTIQNWLEARKCEQFADNGEPIINKFTLDVYQVEKVVHSDIDRVIWVLVGDAAMGLPFFRSLNCGFLNGTQLAANISRELHAPAPNLSTYENYFLRLADLEKGSVHLKTYFLRTYIEEVYTTQWARRGCKKAGSAVLFICKDHARLENQNYASQEDMEEDPTDIRRPLVGLRWTN